DRHPRGHDAARRAGGHEELALVAGEIAHQREPAAALPEDLAHERQRRPREQAAANADLVAVLDAADRVLEARELLGRRLRLGLDAPARGHEVLLGPLPVTISPFPSYRSTSP